MPTSDHFAFQVGDIDKAVDFYAKKLGFKLMFLKVDEDHHEALAFFELAGGNLELLQSLDEHNKPLPFRKRRPKPPYCPHIAIATDNMDATMEMLKANKVSIAAGPFTAHELASWVYVADPAGNVLEYIQWRQKM